MSSGSYFPPPVKAVEIPKKSGGKRILGVPTVADRVAQMVVKIYFEPTVEPHFHPDSYGYRPGKSAADALAVTRQRCWKYDWVLEFDIKGLFDNIDHELLMKAVRKHTDCPWVILYIQRWLKAPFQMPDGTVKKRMKGTPQGGVISPVLANLFLHYAFDVWMARNHPDKPFARYADDGVAHCRSKKEAEKLRESLQKRLAECGLELHPEKTRIVYCKDDDRRGDYPETKFDFLGYGPRTSTESTSSTSPRRSATRRKRPCGRAHASKAGQDLRRPVPDVQSGHQGVGQLLWALLQIGTVFRPLAHEPGLGPLGPTEVPEIRQTQAASGALARQDCQARPETIRPLANGDLSRGWMMGAG